MDLDSILSQIYPDKNQIDCLSSIVSTLGRILINGSGYLKVKKVIPAGSLAKKTILKGHLEVDCVYILEHNGYSYYFNFLEVQRVLRNNLPKVKQFDTSDHSISFELTSPIGCIYVDLLAAFEINSPYQIMEVNDKNAYYGSTSILHDKYFENVENEYSRFTDLVRLLKLWRDTREIQLTSYMLELIASNAIYRTKKDNNFPFYLEACFRTIQSFTDGCPIIPVYWEDYYDNSDITLSYSPNGLWIIDPSDPSDNIANEISDEDKRYIRSEATYGVYNMHNSRYEFLYK
jgi:tRNA nucleotidyltransferase (CCA-adding enzyme)